MVEESMKEKIKKDLEQDPIKAAEEKQKQEETKETEKNEEKPSKEEDEKAAKETERQINKEIEDLNNNGYFRIKILNILEKIGYNLEQIRIIELKKMKKAKEELIQ